MPPLLRILRLNYLRYKGAGKTLPHLADADSKRDLLRTVWKHTSFTRLGTPTDLAAPFVELRVKELGGAPVWCRSGLSDLGVLYDTFVGRYHLPPEDLAPVRTILDLGSNIGLTVAHMAAVYPEARILGVELDEGNWAMCQRNAGERSEVLHAAVWHAPGEVSYGGVRESGYAISDRKVKASVRALTVGELIDRLEVPRVDYVKMDIEGAEQEVLRDAGSWAERVRCLKVEVHPEKASTLYTLGMCVEDLERLGFTCTLDARHHACVVARR
ncbi:MAG: FkbM family methyltransferase [bacterium]|nr:FkbM family methyltransferase [bacterium]